jgi:hypothetical protein
MCRAEVIVERRKVAHCIVVSAEELT